MFPRFTKKLGASLTAGERLLGKSAALAIGTTLVSAAAADGQQLFMRGKLLQTFVLTPTDSIVIRVDTGRTLTGDLGVGLDTVRFDRATRRIILSPGAGQLSPSAGQLPAPVSRDTAKPTYAPSRGHSSHASHSSHRSGALL